MTKLYDVPRDSKILVLSKDNKVPVAAPDIERGDILQFSHVDGMYSLCYDEDGNTVHLAAWTEVEIL